MTPADPTIPHSGPVRTAHASQRPNILQTFLLWQPDPKHRGLLRTRAAPQQTERDGNVGKKLGVE